MVKPMPAIQEHQPSYRTPVKNNQTWNSKAFSRTYTNSCEFKDFSTQDLRKAHQELINELSTLRKHEQEIRQTNIARGLPKSFVAMDIKRIAARRAFLAGLVNEIILILRERKDEERKKAVSTYENFFMRVCEESLPKQLYDRLHETARAKYAARDYLEHAPW